MVLNLRTAVVTGMLLAAAILIVGTTFAAKPEGNNRPGWGFGDTNHTHTGPPGGPSVHPVRG